MSPFNTREDCLRRLGFEKKNFFESLDKLKNAGTPTKPYGQGNGHAFGGASPLRRMGFLYAGLKMYPESLGAFHQMVQFSSLVYEKFYAGLEINPQCIGAGDWQELCLALLTRNDDVIKRFNRVFHRAVFEDDERITGHNIPESTFIGRVLSRLVDGDISEANDILNMNKPNLDPRFRGTYEILDAIACMDEVKIIASIAEAGRYWQKYMQRNQNEVDSISYLYGAGFHHLAENILCKKIAISIPQIPPEMIAPLTYEPYPVPDYAFL